MAQLVADRRDVDFVLHEQLEVEKLSAFEAFEDFNKKTIDLVVSEARNLALKELLTCMKDSDEQGCTFENGTVKVPEAFHRVYDLFKSTSLLICIFHTGQQLFKCKISCF